MILIDPAVENRCPVYQYIYHVLSILPDARSRNTLQGGPKRFILAITIAKQLS